MTGGHPIASDLITNPKACDLITKNKPSVAVGSPGTSDSHRDPGSAGTGTETTDTPIKSARLDMGTNTDNFILMFRSVATQTGDRETQGSGSGQPRVHLPEHTGTQVERPFLAPPGYPTSKLSRPLPDPPLSEGVTQTETTDDMLVAGLKSQGKSDLRWLKWAAGARTPNLVAYVNSIVSASMKRQAEFLRRNPTVNLPRNYSDSWFAPVQIGGKNFFFLCDTGSAATIITPEIYKRIPSMYKTPLVAPDFTLRNASADGVPVSGLCCLEIGLGPEIFPCRVVVADINCDGIIGQNFLEHYKFLLDMASGSIQLPRGKLFMAKGRKPTVSRVHTSEDVMIPAFSQLVLRCRIKSHARMLCSVGVVEPTRKSVLRHGILVGRCLVNARPHIPVLALNPGKAPVFVPAGSFIALVKPVCYLDDQKVEEAFLPESGLRLPRPAVETTVKTHPVPVIVSDCHSRNPAGTLNRTTADLIDPGSDHSSNVGGLVETGVDSVSSLCTNPAPPQGDSPSGSGHGSESRSLSPISRATRSNPWCVHPSLDSITTEVDRLVQTANWVETYGVHPSLDPIRKIEAQGAGVMEGADPDLIPCFEANGEPLIRVRLPTENRNFYFSPETNPHQIPEGVIPTGPNISAANTSDPPVRGDDRYCAATHLLATKDTDDSSSTLDPQGTETDDDSLYLSARSSCTCPGGAESINVDKVTPGTGAVDPTPSTSMEEDTPVPVHSVMARFSHPDEGKLYVPGHLLGLIPEDLQPCEQYQLAKTLCSYEDIFVGPDGILGKTNVVKHEILTGDSRPIKHAPRRVGPHQQEIIQTEVDKMLSAGIITPSDSPWASPIVLVRKKDGSVRFCVDYRKLNAVTVKDAYPLPNIEDAVNTLAGAKYFCTLDLASGYWQVEMSEEAKQKTAFVTREGLFQFNVMPFGLSNAPATFERLMELVLKGMTWRQCVVYIDDIIVFGETFKETHERLQSVFGRLRQAHLRLKPKKCFLFKPSTLYLGYVVSAEGVKPDPNKVEALRTWHRPCDIKGLRAFLGMASYHRKFIRNFSEIAEPLINLTRRKNPWLWEGPQQVAFETLRTALMTEPVLAHPLRDGEFILDTDASAHSLGGALYQMQSGEERLIGYASKTLSGAQKNYCTTKRELLAVVRMVKQFRHYLWGTKFTIRTDHASLTWLLRFKDADGMLARWIAELALYQLTVSYREGKNHLNADGLSRRRCRGCPRLDCPDKASPTSHSLCSSSSDGELDPCDPQEPKNPRMKVMKRKEKLSPLPALVVAAATAAPVPAGPPGQPAYTKVEILELQKGDSDLSPVIAWISQGTDRPDANQMVMGSAAPYCEIPKPLDISPTTRVKMKLNV